MAQARSARAINRRGKTRIRNLWYGPQTRLVRDIISDEFRDDFYPRGTASNFWSRSKAKQVNLKSFSSLYYALACNLEWKKVLNLHLLNNLRNSCGNKSSNSLATQTTLNFSGPCGRGGPLNWPITARVLISLKNLKGSFNYTVRPTVHTNQSREWSFSSETFKLEKFERTAFRFRVDAKKSSSKTRLDFTINE